MGKCGACGGSHPRPGEKSCRFRKDAVKCCKEAGDSPVNWQRYLNQDAGETTKLELVLDLPKRSETLPVMTPLLQPPVTSVQVPTTAVESFVVTVDETEMSEAVEDAVGGIELGLSQLVLASSDETTDPSVKIILQHSPISKHGVPTIASSLSEDESKIEDIVEGPVGGIIDPADSKVGQPYGDGNMEERKKKISAQIIPLEEYPSQLAKVLKDEPPRQSVNVTPQQTTLLKHQVPTTAILSSEDEERVGKLEGAQPCGDRKIIEESTELASAEMDSLEEGLSQLAIVSNDEPPGQSFKTMPEQSVIEKDPVPATTSLSSEEEEAGSVENIEGAIGGAIHPEEAQPFEEENVTDKSDDENGVHIGEMDIVEHLKNYWMLPMYGRTGWVHETHTLCKILKNDELEPFYLKYKKNDPGDITGHAERKILVDLEKLEIQNDGTHRYRCFITSNYSPCHKCSDALREQMPKLLGSKYLRIIIRFANFYKIHYSDECKLNWMALQKLVGHQNFELRIFTTAKQWMNMAKIYFKLRIGRDLNLSEERRLVTISNRRQEGDRAREDRKILDCLCAYVRHSYFIEEWKKRKFRYKQPNI